jgi:hypothetical protein
MENKQAFPSGSVRKTRQRPRDAGSDFIVSDTVEAMDAGMTLRDYFAAKAMNGLLAAGCLIRPMYGMVRAFNENEVADQAYAMADAMLVAGKNK